MKKIGLLVCLLFVLPFGVFAATNPSVKELSAKSDGSKITYDGTMEDGSHAVMCKLYNSKDEEIKLLSSAVDKTKFKGEFTVENVGTYTVVCANYEGGEIKKVEVEVKEEKNTTDSDAKAETKTNPKTGDNYTMLIIVLGASVIGLGLCIMYFKGKKTKNN